MQFFFEIFDSSLPRLGPGDNAYTRKALAMLAPVKVYSCADSNRSNLRVLDIGCGNGAQTIELAKHVDGSILAVDTHQPFLDELQRRAREAGVADKIQVCRKDMAELGQAHTSYDLIWSEGALYSMGFKEGLAMCRNLLAPEGRMAVSELCWFQPDPPAEICAFFRDEYPPMVDAEANAVIIRQCGYDLLGQFKLPRAAWMENYYLPLEKRLRTMQQDYSAEPVKLELIHSVQREIEMYRKYGHHYGYIFYLMKPSKSYS